MMQKYLKECFRRLSLLSALFLSLTFTAAAQSGSAMSDSETDSFLKILSARTSSVITMSADFKQTKKMEMLKKDMVSEGKFFFAKENKIAFLYEKPGRYSMVMSGSFIKMSTASGSSKMDLSANPVMKEMNGLISGVFTGTLDKMSANYNIDFQISGEDVLAIISPKSARIAGIISLIKIVFKKGTGDIKWIEVTEGSGSLTKYLFFNQKINQPISNEIFNIN